MLDEERAERPGAGRGDLDVPFDERVRCAVRVAAFHHGVGVRAGHRPPVLHRLAPHRRRQLGGGLERQPEQLGAHRPRAAFDGAGSDGFEELLEVVERRKDHHAASLAETADDGQAGAVDAERRDVHPDHLPLVGDRPRLDRVQGAAGREQLLDRGGGHASRAEVARFVRGRRQRRDQVIEECIELRRRGDRDGYGSRNLGAHLGGGGGVGYADDVRLPRRSDRGLRHGAAQRACNGALRVFGHDDCLTDDDAVRQLHPEHDLGAAGLRAIADEEGC